MGIILIPPVTSDTNESTGPRGYVYLKVDGQTAAKTAMNPRYNESGSFSVSINTLQQLDAGQVVTIEYSGFNGTLLEAYSSKDVHWTGTYIGSGTPALPECEFVGQTIEYPGSCRLYYLCQSDGTLEIMSCCPDIFSPSAEACISEEEADVEFLCNSEDVCD